MACYGCTKCGKCMTFAGTLQTRCLACGQELEDGVLACPNCGAPTPPPAGYTSWSDSPDDDGTKITETA